MEGKSRGNNDDLLYGFNDDEGGNAILNPFNNPPPPTALKHTVPTSKGVATRGTTGRLGTAVAGSNPNERPVTSVKGAGYQSKGMQEFMNSSLPQTKLVEKTSLGPEEESLKMEKEINAFLEESATISTKNDYRNALDKAKMAVAAERKLTKFREENSLGDQMNLDLKFAVDFNLAYCFQLNEMYSEANKAYETIVKNKQYTQAAKLRINVGNILFNQGDYAQAIKMYKMTLDRIPATYKYEQLKVQKNVAIASIKSGNYRNAILSLENIVSSPGYVDFQSLYNLIICYYAVEDTSKMRTYFTTMVNIPLKEEYSYSVVETDDNKLLKRDLLEEYNFNYRKKCEQYIVKVAKLIAPKVVEATKKNEKMNTTTSASKSYNIFEGYDWVINQLKENYIHLANELEVCKAIEYLKDRRIDEATKVLRGPEKRDQQMNTQVANNLSFLYYLQEDYKEADLYSDLALKADRYNARGLVNKGNCLFAQENYERAGQLYLEAIGIESDCSEAIYNLGIVRKKMGDYEGALQAFEKLFQSNSHDIEVLYQLATLNESLHRPDEAIKHYNILITRVPTDPNILAKLGQLFSEIHDDSQALHYYQESYKFYPANFDVISYLGLYYVRSEIYDEAIKYFKKATELEPNEVKWKLMVASCYRRLGDLKLAFKLYKNINKEFPDNTECLRYLIALCKDLGEDSDQYSSKFASLERSMRPKGQTTFAAPQSYANQNEQQPQYYRNDQQEANPNQPNVRRPPPRGPPPAAGGSANVNVSSAPQINRMVQNTRETKEDAFDFADDDVNGMLYAQR